MLENRGAKSKGSINRLGLFQTGEIIGLEAHVKDTARFKGGWGFFAIQGETAAKQIPYTAACYSLPRGPWRSRHNVRAVLSDAAACRNAPPNAEPRVRGGHEVAAPNQAGRRLVIS